MKSMSLEILSGSTATLLLSTPTSLNVAGTAGTAGFREIVLSLYLKLIITIKVRYPKESSANVLHVLG